ncbi:MAG: hypothetical protein ACLQUY_07905 [Ktedonobacterales bacterium]
MSQQSGKNESVAPPEQPPAIRPVGEEELTQSTHTLGYVARRAERIAQLNQLSPDVPQLLVATAGALLVGILYLVLPTQLIVGPQWLLLAIETLLLAPPLIAVVFWRRHLPYRIARGQAVALSSILTAALIASVLLLVAAITGASPNLAGRVLLKAGGVLWACNVLVFAAWYWEFDGGGPRARKLDKHQAQDFRFPQQEEGNPTGWAPGVIDYIFLAFCSATALSPADTMPLTQRAKLMTMAEAILSLVIIVLLVARSVNILG